MKISGVGVSEVSSEAHFVVSGSTKVVSFVCAWLAAAGVRREMVSTRLMDGWLRRVVRMWLPFLVGEADGEWLLVEFISGLCTYMLCMR